MAKKDGAAGDGGTGKGKSGVQRKNDAAPLPTSALVPEAAAESGPGLLAVGAPWISLVARLALGAMWLFYSLPKLGSPEVNVASVRNFQILPSGLVSTFAYSQPYVELALGLLIIAGLGTRLVAALSGLALLVYIGGIASLGARGIHITCGCGGAGGAVAAGKTRYTLDILRDVAYLIPVAWLLWKPDSKLSADSVLLLPEPEPITVVPPARRVAAKGGSARA